MGSPRRRAHIAFFEFTSLVFGLSLLACTENEHATEKEPSESLPVAGKSAKSAEKTGAAQTETAQSAPSKAKGENPNASGETQKTGLSGAACLAGKWHYNFADNAVETMMANLPQGKVTKEAGDLICENTLTGQEGTVTCKTAGGKPVVIEVTANQGGMPLSIHMTMSGKTSSKFKVLDEKTMQITSAALGDLKIDVEATIAGNKIPFPTVPLLESLTGEMGATNSFACEEDKLRLRPQIDAKTGWQELTRLK